MSNIVSLHSDDYYENKAIESFEKGVHCLREREYKEAISWFKEAARFDEKNPEYKFYCGLTHYLVENLNEAEDYLGYVLEEEQVENEHLFMYGMVLYRKKDYKRAVNIYKQVYSQNSKHAEVLYYLGKSYAELYRYDESISTFKTAIENGQERYDICFELGCVLLLIHDYTQSELYFKRSLELNENNIVVYYYLSKLYLKKGEHDRSITLLNELKEKFPQEKELVEQNIKAIEMLKEL